VGGELGFDEAPHGGSKTLVVLREQGVQHVANYTTG
jgi:hypothetical protein